MIAHRRIIRRTALSATAGLAALVLAAKGAAGPGDQDDVRLAHVGGEPVPEDMSGDDGPAP